MELDYIPNFISFYVKDLYDLKTKSEFILKDSNYTNFI